MSNGRKPPRLWLRNRERAGRKSMWIIKDGGDHHHTGCSVEDRIGAEKALGDYIAAKWTAPEVGRSDMPISEVLTIYGSEHGITTADPARIGHAIDALLPFWGDDPISSIKGEKCRRYNRWRKRAPGTVRRELGTLRAALRYCQTEGYITNAPAIWLPEKPAPKERWLTREEVAKLLWAIREEDNRTKHLLRFVLIERRNGRRLFAFLADCLIICGFGKVRARGSLNIVVAASVILRRDGTLPGTVLDFPKSLLTSFDTQRSHGPCKILAHPSGFEPETSAFGGDRRRQ